MSKLKATGFPRNWRFTYSHAGHGRVELLGHLLGVLPMDAEAPGPDKLFSRGLEPVAPEDSPEVIEFPEPLDREVEEALLPRFITLGSVDPESHLRLDDVESFTQKHGAIFTEINT